MFATFDKNSVNAFHAFAAWRTSRRGRKRSLSSYRNVRNSENGISFVLGKGPYQGHWPHVGLAQKARHAERPA